MSWDQIQLDGLAEIPKAIADGCTRICLTAPTGAGKSHMMAMQVERSKRVVVYTHRRMLFDQLSKTLDSHGLEHGRRAAGHDKRLLDDLQLAMIQSEASWMKKDKDLHECDQYHVDEIHVNSGATMQEIVDRHGQQGAVGIFWTATPLGIGHICDRLIVVASNSEMRKCGALVPAYHYGPDEPDTKWIKNIKVDEGECGIPNAKRGAFAKQVFGRVVEHYGRLNPEGLPTVLFAPGVKESVWFAERLTEAGIPTAHIDGSNCWIDGELVQSTTELREEIRDRCQSGDVKIVSNRFVLREGIDWPWLRHGILATVFGSLTSYIQACGRLLRASEGKDASTIQDHGGNWWRHGSINSDWGWSLDEDNRTRAGERKRRLSEKREPEPIVCPKCFACRLSGPICHACGYTYRGKSRPVLQKDGTLREMKGDIYRKPRRAEADSSMAREWPQRVRAICRSQKETVQWMTAAQLEANMARQHHWTYPPKGCQFMPTADRDWFRPLRQLYPELVPHRETEAPEKPF